MQNTEGILTPGTGNTQPFCEQTGEMRHCRSIFPSLPVGMCGLLELYLAGWPFFKENLELFLKRDTECHISLVNRSRLGGMMLRWAGRSPLHEQN